MEVTESVYPFNVRSGSLYSFVPTVRTHIVSYFDALVVIDEKFSLQIEALDRVLYENQNE